MTKSYCVFSSFLPGYLLTKFTSVLGDSGAGKSSLIRECSQYNQVDVGNGLKTTTNGITVIRAKTQLGSPGLVFVDTPGFNQRLLSDDHVLQIIEDWCATLYTSNFSIYFSKLIQLYVLVAKNV
ncbi:hypothetical protein CPB83DRAFT_851686 [Crepidotus variabilis]|uniref:EngC GTPase domain-containing protein n=1 Tax=Crepidotus variabilis TaxID=179855 RepID=A0A9P6JQN2_9AGAR|nr:hypothetical protein CPB83DRAFT_851686 [Crepidotus variabilis]